LPDGAIRFEEASQIGRYFYGKFPWSENQGNDQRRLRMKVKNLMVPLSECPRVAEDLSLADAVSVLETWRQKIETREYRLRVLLVHDAGFRITGTLRHQDMLRVFAPGKENSAFFPAPAKGLPTWDDLLAASLNIARQVRVGDVKHTPGEAEFIDENAPLEEGFYRLQKYPSLHLMVRSGEEVAGILRISDIFSLLCQEIQKAKSMA
jgi:hypothetical protein